MLKVTLLTCVYATSSILLAQASDTLTRDSEQLARCLQALDTECFVQLAHIESYERLSPPGTDVADILSAFFETLRRDDMRYAAVTFSDPWYVIEDEERLYAFVPYSATITHNNETRQGNSYLIAVSQDDAISWKFVDGSNLTSESIRSIIPTYGDQPLPEVTDPAS